MPFPMIGAQYGLWERKKMKEAADAIKKMLPAKKAGPKPAAKLKPVPSEELQKDIETLRKQKGGAYGLRGGG